jgi:hypothetical protein
VLDLNGESIMVWNIQRGQSADILIFFATKNLQEDLIFAKKDISIRLIAPFFSVVADGIYV